METNQAPAQEIARKITLRTCGCTVEAIKAAVGDLKEGEGVELLKIAGVTTSCAVGQTDKGEFIRLNGEFLAVNQITGELVNAEPSARLSKLLAVAGMDKPLALTAPKAEEAPAKGKKTA